MGSEIGEQAAADAQAGLPIDSFDLDAARAELAQSKVPGGFSAELTYPSSIPDLGSTALAIADNLKQIGVNLTVTSKPIEEWISEVGSGTYGLSFMSYTSTTGDPGEVVGWLLGPDNPARYENAQVQGLIALAGRPDRSERARRRYHRSRAHRTGQHDLLADLVGQDLDRILEDRYTE